jgi:hypothetical protein
MSHDMVPIPSRDLDRAGLERLPAMIARAGEGAAWRFVEFFTANIRNRNTRAAYAQAVAQFFRWCEARSIAMPVTLTRNALPVEVLRETEDENANAFFPPPLRPSAARGSRELGRMAS